jgi:hypothetical protein
VLVGDYRLLGLIGFNPEHNARTRIVHFPRYSSRETDGIEFAETLSRLTARLNRHFPAEIDSSAALIKERSIGNSGFPAVDSSII